MNYYTTDTSQRNTVIAEPITEHQPAPIKDDTLEFEWVNRDGKLVRV